MTSDEASAEPREGSDLRTSRRTFLLAAGSSAGVGLSATPAGASRGGASTDPVTVVASPSQRGVARAAVDGVGRDPSTPADAASVTLHAAETTSGLRRFADGDVDVLAGSRPILPAERSRTVGNGVEYERREFPTAVAALRHPESSWVDPLRPARLAETWAGDGVVETWAEAAPATDPDAVVRHLSSGGPTDGPSANDSPDDRTMPTREGTVLVRGVRAHQYATGFGGVGYYEPELDWLGRRPDTIEPGAGSRTPLVRLAFLYVNRESLRRRPVADLVGAYTRRGVERVGDLPYYGDPFGSG